MSTEDGFDFAALVAGGGDRPRTASEFVQRALRTAILEGRIPPGTPLRQEALAAAFDVSRMPVREALRQLEAQALLEFTPHKGAVVAELSAQDQADTYLIRRALEPVALARSIPHLTRDDLDRAEDLIADMDRESDHGRLGELNRRFHLSLYAHAGSPKLLRLVERQLTEHDRYLRFHLAMMGRDRMSQDDHLAMVAAAAARDIEAATVVLQRHIDVAAEDSARFFDR
ncbi:GntR family transcriptional regulator [Thalassobaculum litoreum]|uniref:DNA-binding transcriptional regulator, GntR family n=1 Tax=Thalassobaculum litoreum DSM 18839 TaxID=1123362 RepID=A0A8G2EZJ6_9PROT|nr:GntR family transcriptional regulator [Thalassobaculum litoreum]SDG28076.1 DNA-binding transcriptional regulator, GntR family [Thalassobaculum litoreum DSM 18839]